ncbi:MAG: slipin family protein [Rhodobacteraceae bacterium]|nr:slipin family protein [Paracoccaceae bacterium]
MELIEKLAGFTRLTVTENHRVLVIKNGMFRDILGAGMHWIKRRNTQYELHDITSGAFASSFDQSLFRVRPELAETHLTEVSAEDTEVVLVSRKGRVDHALNPGSRLVLWRDAGPWTLERFDITGALDIQRSVAMRLLQAGKTTMLTAIRVEEGTVNLLFVDGAFERVLDSGSHWFWKAGRVTSVKLIDTRVRSHEVAGQEILTRDRVSLRVNLSAEFCVTDPVLAATSVKDFEEALHRSLQFAFRKTLGAKSLDEMLSEKVSVDETAAAEVRAEMARIGLDVGAISLKDVILPGDMRDILNGVVAAQKEAEANVIRRREETNATRSLLNTAKVMAENPVMLRLKELEALETIAGKVDRLTVHNGTSGLMSDLVKLTD